MFHTSVSYYDERNFTWTREGLQEAVKILVKGPNTLYDDMIKQVTEYPKLSMMLQNILFRGIEYPCHEYNKVIHIGKMLGFIEDRKEVAAVSNRIFEMQLYSYFISEEFSRDQTLGDQIPDKNQFVHDGRLNMDLVMRKFYELLSVFISSGRSEICRRIWTQDIFDVFEADY